MALTRQDIEKYLREVGAELEGRGLRGEILIVGGAFMALVLRARNTTKDVDAIVASDPKPMREAVAQVAKRHALPADWLNDAVKGFIYTRPPMRLWAEYPGLRVYVPGTDYMFAMKADSARPEDHADLVRLCHELKFKSAEEALRVVERYIPAAKLRIQTQLTIESLFEGLSDIE
jgi:predicted nucleotidyltransferase